MTPFGIIKKFFLPLFLAMIIAILSWVVRDYEREMKETYAGLAGEEAVVSEGEVAGQQSSP